MRYRNLRLTLTLMMMMMMMMMILLLMMMLGLMLVVAGVMKSNDIVLLFKGVSFHTDDIRQYIISLLHKFEVALLWDSDNLLIPSLLPTELDLIKNPSLMHQVLVCHSHRHSSSTRAYQYFWLMFNSTSVQVP